MTDMVRSGRIQKVVALYPQKGWIAHIGRGLSHIADFQGMREITKENMDSWLAFFLILLPFISLVAFLITAFGFWFS